MCRPGHYVLLCCRSGTERGAAQEYLSDGITDEIFPRSGACIRRGLSVVARTSVMRYKDSTLRVSGNRPRLAVDFVLEGSVLRETDTIPSS